MVPSEVDYSLYLVTDSTPEILGNRSLVTVVEAALRGGVTVVQYRDKTASTRELVATAKALHAVTTRFNVPLLINDRLDVALAVGCEGIHIGQDDLDLATARKMLGKDAIVGVSISNIDEAQEACRGGADYIGIGTVFATATKKDTKDVIGTAGIKSILRAISVVGQEVKTVCIGGINATNVWRVLYQGSDMSKSLDGVAVVSAIVAAKDPQKAAQELQELSKNTPTFQQETERSHAPGLVLERIPDILKTANKMTPLSHNMTNLVVQNFAANVALAVGGSPIMANYGEEASDLSKLGGSLVINMGTVTPEGLENYTKALKAYNFARRPVVFDPVGGGATAVRRAAITTLLSRGYFDVIKGNEGEIKAVLGSTEQQKGVDSGPSASTEIEKASLVRDLALRERNIIVMTGATDYVSDGYRIFAISNGHELLGRITGSGCVLGTIISIMLSIDSEDKLPGVVAALLCYEIAAEMAASRPEVKGPGSFVPALIDELDAIRQTTSACNSEWLSKARVRSIKI